MKPTIIKHKKPFLNFFRKNKDEVLIVSAYGEKTNITIRSNSLKELKGDYSAVANATFQDAKNKKPIFLGSWVALWQPQDKNFVPPENARVFMCAEKLKMLGRSKDGINRNFEYPLVKDVIEKDGVQPDYNDDYLVDFHRSSEEFSRPYGQWLMKRFSFNNNKLTPYVEIPTRYM